MAKSSLRLTVLLPIPLDCLLKTCLGCLLIWALPIQIQGQSMEDAAYTLQNGRAIWIEGYYDSAYVFFQEGEKLARKEQNFPLITDALALQGKYLTRMGRLQAGEQYLNQAIEMEEVVGAAYKEIILARCERAYSQALRGDYDAMLSQYLEVKDQMERFEKGAVADSVQAMVYHQVGNAYSVHGEMDSSIRYANLTLDIRRRIFPPDHITIAYTENSLGVAYNWLEDYEASLAHYQNAYEILQKKFRPSHTQLNQIKTNIAVLYEDLGLFWEALRLHRETLTYVDELTPDAQMATYFNLASTLGVVGDAKEALFYLDRAEELVAQYPNINPLMKGKIQSERGGAYFSIGNIDSALTYTLASIRVTSELMGEDHEENIIEYTRLGNYYTELAQYTIANQNFLRAIEIAAKAYPKGNVIRGWAWEFYAESLIKQDRNEEGLTALDSAEKSYQVGSASWGLGDVHWKRARAYRQLGSWDKTFEMHEKAWQVVVPELPFVRKPKEAISAYWDRFPVPYLLLEQAETMRQYGQIHQDLPAQEAAWACLHAYLMVKDSHRHYYEAPDSKQQGIEEQRVAVEKMLELAMALYEQQGNPEILSRSWEWAEKTKAAQLHQHIRSQEALQFAGIPDALIQKERYYRQRLAALSAQTPENAAYVVSPDSQRRATILQLRKAYQAFTDDLERQFPQYYRLKYSSNADELDTWLTRLHLSSLVYSYFWGNEKLYVCRMSSGKLSLHTVKETSSLDTWLAFIHQPPTQEAFDYSLIPRLTASLLPELAHSTKRLIVIPDGKLGYLPFESLLLTSPEDLDYRRWDFLVQHYSCSYQPSLGLLMDRLEEKSVKNYLGWAPVFERGIHDPTRSGLGPLKHNQQEIQEAAQLLEGRYLLGAQAQEARVKNLELSSPILHFATHAVADEDDLMRSRLYLAPPTDSLEDGILYAHELYGMELRSPLVVLSACQTAKGPLRQGEGVMSLARAFRYAGARRTVTTLWQLDDASGATLSQSFFQKLADETPIDFALQEAKQSWINQSESYRCHPYFWSGYILIGNGEVWNKGASIWWWGGLSMIILMILGGFLWKKITTR
ncbi:MAG: CHAT domain-containing tetratricopeptide repeat protein [Bacteroidota bacterium]